MNACSLRLADFVLMSLFALSLERTSAQTRSVTWSTFSMGYQQSVTQTSKLKSVAGQLFVDEATQTQGGVSSGFLADTLLRPIEYSAAVQVNGAWNLISLPIEVVNMPKVFLFPSAILPAYRFAGGYVEAPLMNNGIGYWLKFSSAQSIGLAGDIILRDTIDVVPGWNMIGCLSEKISVSSIWSIPPGLTVSPFFRFSTAIGYSQSDTLVPGLGYWVKASQGGRLILNVSGTTNREAKVHIVENGEQPPPPPGFEQGLALPTFFALQQNYPNPFNPTTTIHYQLPIDTRVTLKVFNVLGQEVRTLVDDTQTAGYRSVVWDTRNDQGNQIASGVYFYRLQTREYTKTLKLMVLR